MRICKQDTDDPAFQHHRKRLNGCSQHFVTTGKGKAVLFLHGFPDLWCTRDARIAMATIDIIGAGEVGSQPARAAITGGCNVVIANSCGPETLGELIAGLGPNICAASVAGVSEAGDFETGDFVVVAVLLKLVNNMPAEQLAGKIALGMNSYIMRRDGGKTAVASGAKTVHELRQEQLPTPKVARAFSHIQAPNFFVLGGPTGASNRHTLSVSSDDSEAVELVTRRVDQFGFDAVDNSPLSESWRSGPGQPAWKAAFAHQARDGPATTLVDVRRLTPARDLAEA